MAAMTLKINRAPVLTLWAAVVAERIGFDRDEALTLGKAVAGLNAQAKGRRLGIFKPSEAVERRAKKKIGLGEEFWIQLCGRGVPAKNTEDGVRAVVKARPINPERVQAYLVKKFGDALGGVRSAMAELAAAFDPDVLANAAYGLYEKFRPQIAPGKRGWGQQGTLDLGLILSLTKET